MSMIICYECEAKISDLALACPHCGAPANKTRPPASKLVTDSTSDGVPMPAQIVDSTGTHSATPSAGRGRINWVKFIVQLVVISIAFKIFGAILGAALTAAVVTWEWIGPNKRALQISATFAVLLVGLMTWLVAVGSMHKYFLVPAEGFPTNAGKLATGVSIPGETPENGLSASPALKNEAERQGIVVEKEPRVSFTAYGYVRIGMTRQALEMALGAKLKSDDPDWAVSEGCEYVVATEGYEGLSFMLIDQRLARIDVASRKVKTLAGAHVGTTQKAILAMYPGRVEVSPNAYDADNSYLTMFSSDKQHGIRFETDKNGEVGYFYAGTAEAIQYIEGCL